MDLSATMSEAELTLEAKCAACGGNGGKLWRGEEEGWRECAKCNGSGYVPTDIGARILKLVRHNSRLTVSAELHVAGAAV